MECSCGLSVAGRVVERANEIHPAGCLFLFDPEKECPHTPPPPRLSSFIVDELLCSLVDTPTSSLRKQSMSESTAADLAAKEGYEEISGDGGLFKKILVPGDPSAGSPPSGSKVTVHYVGTLLDGSKFDSSRDRPGFFEFDVGVGRVIKGWDMGICTMHKGEKCMLMCTSDYAYGDHGSPPKIPGGATLLFEVELFSWKEQRKEREMMSDEEQLSEATASKAKGTELFKAGNFSGALEKYANAAYYIGGDDEGFVPKEGKEEEATTLYSSSLLNAATCANKLGEYVDAVAFCSRAIAADEKSVKAFFRRGTARMHLGEFTDAKADLRKASELDPKSKEVRDTFAECTKKEAASKKSEQAMYAKMFGS